MATSATHDERRIIFDFADEIDIRSQFGVDGFGNDQKFVSRDALKEFWTDWRIRKLVGKLHLSVETVRTEYLQVLSTLAFIDRVNDLEAFTKYSLRDDFLPLGNFSRTGWPTGEVYLGLFEAFARAQWRFFPLALRRNHLENRHVHSDQILPWQRLPIMKPGRGGDSMIYKVEIAEGYNELSDTNSQPGDNIFILKTYSERRLYNNERKAFTALKDQPSNHIVGFYGSFKQDETYHLILEYVNGGTLLDLFQTMPPPSTAHEIRDFWQSFMGIFEGLYRIHQLTKHAEFAGTYRIVHQDIKPENILLKRHPGSLPYQFEAKIADFGYSDVRFVEPGGEDKLGLDRQGGQMYSAPECCHNEKYLRGINMITAEADIFSIGCVTSDTTVWMAFGREGRARYRELRQQENARLTSFQGSGYNGCFHNGDEVLQAVQDMHIKVREQLAPLGDITANIITIAEELMLPGKASLRGDARKIKQRFGHVLDGYRSPTSASSPSLGGVSSYTRPLLPQQQDHPRKRSVSDVSPVTATNNPFSSLEPTPPLLPVDSPTSCDPGIVPTRPPIFPLSPSTPEPDRSQKRHSSVRRMKDSFRKSWSSLIDPISPNRDYCPIGPPTPVESSQNGPWLTFDQAYNYREKKRNSEQVDRHVEKKIQNLKEHLHGRDQLFFIDDSNTMAPMANEVLKAFKVMSYIAKQIDPDAIELVFASRPTMVVKKPATRPLVELLKNHEYSMERSLMELRMDEFMDQVLVPRLSGLLRGRIPGLPAKPISILVFTDGAWGEGLDEAAGVQRPIKRLMTILQNRRIPRTKVMFQFIRFGSSSDGQKYLSHLDNFGRKQGCDIVDTKPWPDVDLWPMFVGSLAEDVDGQDENLIGLPPG